METFIIIKSDAVNRGLMGKIISRFERKGFKIVKIEQHYKDGDWVKQQYAHVFTELPKLERPLTVAMFNVPLIGIILSGPDGIIETVRQMIGITDSMKAEPGTIRGDYGNYPTCYNLLHASDSAEAVIRESKSFFNVETDYPGFYSSKLAIPYCPHGEEHSDGYANCECM